MSYYNNVYWEKIEGGSLWLQYCLDCKRFIFYPRSMCPYCWGTNLEWRETSGRGRVYTYTVVRVSSLPEFSKEVPYIYAVIELDEGVKIPSNLQGCSLEEVEIDMPVELAFIEREGEKIPVFKLAR